MGLFKILFPKIPSRKFVEERDKRIVKRLVSKYGVDEPNLFLGRYVTSQDTERMREEVSKYGFV